MNDYDKIITLWHKVQDLECHERFMNISKYLAIGISDLIFRNDQEKQEYYDWLKKLEDAKKELDDSFNIAITRKRSKNGI